MNSEFRFCLLMIVRDESQVIERCLESVKNFCDSYLICDTGSTDDTVQKIKDKMTTLNIPGEVITQEWKNFGWNKSFLLKSFREHPIYSKSKYIFWLDADEVYIKDKNDPVSYLRQEDGNHLYNFLEVRKENIYNSMTVYGNLNYRRPQMARNNQLYRWDYPVHEIFVGDTDNSSILLTQFYNLARKEGNSSRNPDRYLKDIKMFEDYLEEHPNDSRALFYLAQTAEHLDREKSITNYKKRLEVGGYYDERYITCLRLGRMLDNVNDKQHYWLEGKNINSERLESIYELMMFYHYSGDNKKAFQVGLLAPENRENVDFLFTEYDIYNWMFDMYFSICAYYVGEFKLAYKHGKSILDRKKYPEHVKSQLEKNMEYYRSKLASRDLETSSSQKISPPLPTIVIIDNFYENPDEVRKNALSMKYDVKGNYPGMRTCSSATEEHKRKIESIFGRRIDYWPDGYNGSYQIVTKNDSSWIHRDKTDYSMIVFLTPNPPVNGGTVLYRHKRTGVQKTNDSKIEDELNRDSRNFDNWEVVDRVGNLYNRAVIFNGSLSHMSDVYFGEDKETGRLFQTFFFNVEKD